MNTTTDTIYVVSGEGEQGTRERYTGKLTQRAMRRRQRKEECGGDRWCRFESASGERVYPEQYA